MPYAVLIAYPRHPGFKLFIKLEDDFRMLYLWVLDLFETHEKF